MVSPGRSGRFHVYFTKNVSLGSVMTLVIACVMILEVAAFYGALSAQVGEAREYQKVNREAIEQLKVEMTRYNKWSLEQSGTFASSIDAISDQVKRLQDDVRTLKAGRQ